MLIRKNKKKYVHDFDSPVFKIKNYWDRPDLMGWHGYRRKYKAVDLWAVAKEYFNWIQENPLYEQKVFANGYSVEVCKMRAMTYEGFCVFAGLNKSTFLHLENSTDDDLRDVVATIKDIIYAQKIEGAAADLLNANIVSSELGLRNRVEVTTKAEKAEFKGFDFLPYTEIPDLKTDKDEGKPETEASV